MLRRPRLIPCLLLLDGGLVKTTRFRQPNYLGDPINTVRLFSEMGVDELCIQDISPSRYDRGPDFHALRVIARQAFMPMCYGGGITTVEQAAELFRIGFEKVMLNAALVRQPELITQIAKRFGSQSVVASVDVGRNWLGKRYCYIHNGKACVKTSAQELCLRAQELGAGEILLNSIDRDGTMQGYDLELIDTVSRELSIPLIACGGARDATDMKRVLTQTHAHAVAAGSMYVYWGPLKGKLIHVPPEEELKALGIYQ
ncbi:MAG: AglZ/HisF2 family acetamidino modification protein [Clostridia bacterium]|nr:AglZ/HisF2 family acetamidino modification protein [Clostridia bacterium]MDD6039614.1 AglZ/HisF2 family acetamidino modification protein [Clostridia bacterium]